MTEVEGSRSARPRPIELQAIELVELHDARLRAFAWDWEGWAKASVTEAFLYVRWEGEAVGYDVFNADIDLVCSGVRAVSAEGGAFSRHDTIFDAEVIEQGRRIELVSLWTNTRVEQLEMTFFPVGRLTVTCQQLQARIVSEPERVGRWPGALDDPNVRPDF